ncbi:hypothetical protein [Pararhizobium mangrovi]|uniref:Uncharacterized protein n=1 Tax=Pararhizobium mangrovi TaxID=2590452 RepID=A0A506U3L2_9HYPH|nr:hypothetical protein [Pararhizobium mangrovi]TPW26477.1 hypothetical protein FJU11_14855 [Pararhizobium mangrovi]
MRDENQKKKSGWHDPERRTRRLSVFLILGIIVVGAGIAWVASSWYSRTYGSGKIDDMPTPPPSVGEGKS